MFEKAADIQNAMPKRMEVVVYMLVILVELSLTRIQCQIC
jgi:hypothetical protein